MRTLKITVLTITLLFAFRPLFSQSDSVGLYTMDSLFSFRSPKGYVPSLFHNLGVQATAPVHFKTKEWIFTGAAVGITFLLIENDNKIEKWAVNQNEQYSWVHLASPEVTKFGATYGGIALGGIAVLSAAFKHKKGVETSLLATQALITSGIWIRLLKLAAGRERPYSSTATGSERGKQWYGPLPLYDKTFVDRKALEAFDSFPSGHTDVAFSIATVFAEQYNDTPVVPIISYSIATLVGLSRLTEHQHWSSDVFVSSIIGYACGKQVVNHFKKMQATHQTSASLKRKTKTTFSLIQYGNQVGITMKW